MSVVTVFISCAQEDEAYKAEFLKHLRPWTDNGRFEVWEEGEIGAGTEWEEATLQALDHASVVVFLVSADLLASEFVRDVALPRAMERRRLGEVSIFPVIVRACPWKQTSLGKLQALRRGEPIPRSHSDAAWTKIAQRLADTVTFMAKEPEPNYLDERNRELSLALAKAYRQEEELAANGGDSVAIRDEIIRIKREMREDGLNPGDLLSGRYKLVAPIGQGGFAKVWKAWDTRMRRLVAVKVLHQQYARDRTRRQRFFRGAKQMAWLSHPSIVRIFGEPERRDGSCRYFVMEYVEGGDLRRAVFDTALTVTERLRIIEDIGVALDYAHQRGIIHRDVKPGNVLLDSEGRAKLTDFDLVRAQDSTGGTRTGMLGTVVYAAPEAMEHAKEAGVPADVFGLGMTAIFALHGADLPARELLRDAPGFTKKLNAPNSVRTALARAVAWEAEERHGSVADLCAELASGNQDKPAPQKSETPPRRKAPAIKTHRSYSEDLFLSIETPLDGRKELWQEIPAGKGWIGSPEAEGHADERPQHRVELEKPFYLASVPVTAAQYTAFDSGHARKSLPNLPVVNISWRRAMAFCEWLGGTFSWARGARLPTEEEWEFAARAGAGTRYWSGETIEDLERAGWYSGNSEHHIHAVGEKPANRWGLHDVHGNVWEWTLSKWKANYAEQADGLEIDPSVEPPDLDRDFDTRRVLRGGCCLNKTNATRLAYRDHSDPLRSHLLWSFRVLLPTTGRPPRS